MDGSGNGYLKTVCDYVHLNPARAQLLAADDPLTAYPWSSLGWYLAAREHRPAWIRTERLLGAHGIPHDTAAGRQEFQNRLEARRRSEEEDQDWESIEHGWCVGSEEFKTELLERLENRLGEHHAGELKRESAEDKAERIIAEELMRLGWSQADLKLRLKGDPAKMALANPLRRETILSVNWIAARLSMGTARSARARLHKWNRNETKTKDHLWDNTLGLG